MIPWFWREYQMPPREVEHLTLRQADDLVMDWVRRQESAKR